MKSKIKVGAAVVVMVLLIGKESGEASSFYSQTMDSSVGKSPFIMRANTAGARDAAGGWDRIGQSNIGKPPVVVLSEGPPPGKRTGSQAGFFYLYADDNTPFNHFLPTGYMGDRQDVQMNAQSVEEPAVGRTCVKITYTPILDKGQGWAGVYWLNPRTNWGYRPGGYNLSRMTRVTFWARGKKGGEQIALFKVGGIKGTHPDTGSADIGPVWLSHEWQQYTIDLRGIDLSNISGGFAWSANGSDNIGDLAFYLDEIRFEE